MPSTGGVAVAKSVGALVDKLKNMFHEWKLVLHRVRKPEKDEYIHTLKILWLGIILVGVVAYVIHLTAYLILR